MRKRAVALPKPPYAEQRPFPPRARLLGERGGARGAAVPPRGGWGWPPPATTLTVVPNAGHLVHFDHPDLVRSVSRSGVTLHVNETGSVGTRSGASGRPMRLPQRLAGD